MPLYFASHTTACLTKQSTKQLMLTLMKGSEVKVRRCLSSQIGGRMLTEIEAPDLAAVEKYFHVHRVNCEWIMRIDFDANAGAIAEY